MKKLTSKGGFTLIEMLVVIAIIAILVAIVIPTITASVRKANAATDAANLRSVLGEANVIIFNGEKSGTKNTVDYALKHGVEVRNIL